MQIMQGLTSVVTATSTNILTGQLYERMPFNGRMRVLCTGDAVGAGRLTIYAGGQVLMPESVISRQDRNPIDPDDLLLPVARVRAGTQLVLQFRASGGGTSTINWRVLLKPG